MIYAQFFHPSAVEPLKLVPACGDRSVIILDGRRSLTALHAVCMDEEERRGYRGYQLMKGESFTRSEPVTGVYMSPEDAKAGMYAETEH